MQDFIAVWWPVIAFVLGLVGLGVGRYISLYNTTQADKMERMVSDGTDAHERIIGMVDELEGRMSTHEKRTEERIQNVDRKRREGDHELAQDMLALRQRMHDRFVTEKQFGEGMKRFDDLSKRVAAMDKKIDTLPKRIAKQMRNHE